MFPSIDELKVGYFSVNKNMEEMTLTSIQNQK